MLIYTSTGYATTSFKKKQNRSGDLNNITVTKERLENIYN